MSEMANYRLLKSFSESFWGSFVYSVITLGGMNRTWGLGGLRRTGGH